MYNDYEIYLADVPLNAKSPRFLRVEAQVHLTYLDLKDVQI
jgi:hypothetical protein